MVSLVSSTYKYFFGEFPTGIHRTILFSIVPLWMTHQADRGRDFATLGQMAKEGRLSDNTDFSNWVKQINKVEQPLTAKEYFLKAEYRDLLCKVIVSTAFFFTAHVSLRTSLERILALSSTVSKSTQPLLDKMAIPVPSYIAFAPVAVKLLHMASIYYEAPDSVKSVTHKLGNALETLWHLRFSLICLGASQNIIYTITSTVFNRLINYFVTDFIKKNTITILAISLNSIQPLQPVHDLLFGTEFIVQTGFDAGVNGMIGSLFASSAPADLKTLEALDRQVLYNEETARTNIAKALKERKIDAFQANALLERL